MGGEWGEIGGVSESKAEKELWDIELLESGGFDDGSHGGEAEGADFGAIAEGEFAEDDDGAELTFGAIVVELGAGNGQEV